MATLEIDRIIAIVPQLLEIPYKRIWYSYDEEADVLYLNFRKPAHTTDSELTNDDIIIRYENGKIIGLTILNASKRKVKPGI